jgi:hypothetical protein
MIGRRIRTRTRTHALTLVVLLPILGACSDDKTGVGVAAPDGGTAEAGDAGTTPGTCEGACKTTSLTASFGGKDRVLVRAQFGTEPSDAGGSQLHTESHLGGAAACPSQTSPTPDYTLIVTGIARGGAPARQLSKADGVTSAFFDFKGDLGLPPLTKATSIDVTVIAEDSATPPKWVAFDVDAVFSEGTVKGHLYAEFCQSLSE